MHWSFSFLMDQAHWPLFDYGKRHIFVDLPSLCPPHKNVKEEKQLQNYSRDGGRESVQILELTILARKARILAIELRGTYTQVYFLRFFLFPSFLVTYSIFVHVISLSILIII